MGNLDKSNATEVIEQIEEPNSIVDKIENFIDWNLVSIVSIWLFLSFTFFFIFVH